MAARPKYMLERGQHEMVDMGYSYSRRAQSTLDHLVWKQVAYGDDLEALMDLASPAESSTSYWRIIDWGNFTGKVIRQWSARNQEWYIPCGLIRTQ
jgi:hypothetical protein